MSEQSQQSQRGARGDQRKRWTTGQSLKLVGGVLLAFALLGVLAGLSSGDGLPVGALFCAPLGAVFLVGGLVLDARLARR